MLVLGPFYLFLLLLFHNYVFFLLILGFGVQFSVRTVPHTQFSVCFTIVIGYIESIQKSTMLKKKLQRAISVAENEVLPVAECEGKEPLSIKRRHHNTEEEEEGKDSCDVNEKRRKATTTAPTPQ